MSETNARMFLSCHMLNGEQADRHGASLVI
jgi:hypothetical protein